MHHKVFSEYDNSQTHLPLADSRPRALEANGQRVQPQNSRFSCAVRGSGREFISARLKRLGVTLPLKNPQHTIKLIHEPHIAPDSPRAAMECTFRGRKPSCFTMTSSSEPNSQAFSTTTPLASILCRACFFFRPCELGSAITFARIGGGNRTTAAG